LSIRSTPVPRAFLTTGGSTQDGFGAVDGGLNGWTVEIQFELERMENRADIDDRTGFPQPQNAHIRAQILTLFNRLIAFFF
jgi:hypothetical protein